MVFQHPPVSEPHCFTHPDGALRNNPKTNVFKVLKGMVKTEAPQNSNTAIANGMFLIQSTPRCLNYKICFKNYKIQKIFIRSKNCFVCFKINSTQS